MNKLTKKRAQELIKRELGISTTNLEMPPQMNQSPAFPWYELNSGNIRITVYTKHTGVVSYVYMSIYFDNSGINVTQCYYADTMEFAAEATELYRAEELYEKATDIQDWDAYLARAGRACREANQTHFKCN